jgi:GH24 family phage-related lysozyme (muramidase)
MVMSGRLRTSRAGLELIKSFEGFRESAARLPDGRWTIGYGHVRTAREDGRISEAEAEDLLRKDLRPIEEALLDLIYAPINQNQFDALVSLVFNISPGQFKDSGILRSLNAGDYIGAAAGFDPWRKARIHGRVIVVDALVRRRAMEKAMFLEHPDGRPAAPTPMVTPELDVTGVDAPAIQPPQPTRPAVTELDVAEAIRRLASPANDTGSGQPAAPAKPAEPGLAHETILEGADIAATPVGTETADRRASQTMDEARRAVAERVARILERTERQTPQGEPGAPPAMRTAPEAKRPSQPPPTVLQGLPDFDAERTSRAKPDLRNGRAFIDDTETFEPGRHPDELFAEAERVAKVVNGRASRMGILSGRVILLAPWIAVLVLALIGFGVGIVESFRATAAETAGSALIGAPTIAAVFGLMVAMSLYFIVTRASDHEI